MALPSRSQQGLKSYHKGQLAGQQGLAVVAAAIERQSKGLEIADLVAAAVILG